MVIQPSVSEAHAATARTQGMLWLDRSNASCKGWGRCDRRVRCSDMVIQAIVE